MIELRNINASYESKQVFSDLNLKIAESECIALIGANGAGKTTLLKVISGAMKTTGDTLIYNRSLRQMPCQERAALLSIVPQNIDSDTPLAGYDFVMLGRTHCIPRFGAPGQDDRNAVEEAMKVTSTLFLKKRFLNEMSGGERQRLALAMAFAANPRIILLDEATAHLDLHHRAEIMHLLREMNRKRGVTIIMAAHDLTLAGRYFNRLILLKEGRIIKDGPPEKVLTEKNIEDAYGCPVRVVELPDNLGSTVIPMNA